MAQTTLNTAKKTNKKPKKKRESPVKIGLEGSGSKGGGLTVTIEPNERKRRSQKSDRKKSDRRSTRGERPVSRVVIEEVSPAGRDIQPGASVVGIGHGSKIMILSESGVLGFIPEAASADLLVLRRGGARISGTITGRPTPNGLSIELRLSSGTASDSERGKPLVSPRSRDLEASLRATEASATPDSGR